MMLWGGGWGVAGGSVMMIGMIALVALVVVGVVLLLRPVFGRGEAPAGRYGDDSAVSRTTGRDVLDSRYARGEITREEYLARRQDLR
jgi:putative membrane protein